MYLSAQGDIVQMAWHAAQIGDKALLVKMIRGGVDIEKRGGAPVPSTPLQIAAQHQDTTVLEVLLENGANTEAVDSRGRTCLHIAALEGHLRRVKILLFHGASMRTQANDGKSALHFATEKGCIDIITTLIACRSDVSAADKHGWTPLHYAAEHKTPDVMYTLLLCNPKITTNNLGETPSDVARRMGKIAMAEELENISDEHTGDSYRCPASLRTSERSDTNVHPFY
jgi:ankyrin repeat protein